MKTVIFITIATLLLSGCVPGQRYLRSDAPPGGIEIAATDTDAHAVTISSSASWMAGMAGLSEWLGVRYAADVPDLLWVEALERNESLDERRDTITVVSGDGLRLTIPIVQLPMVVSFSVTPRTLEPFGPRESTPRLITVASNLGWEHLTTAQSDWLTLARATDPDTGAETLTISAAPTRELDPRRDTIVVRPLTEAFHSYADSIAVVQRGIDLVVYADAMNPATFDIAIPAAGGETPLSVFSRHPWTVTTDAPADSAALDIAGAGADIENGIPLVVTTPPNTTPEPITFTLTFTAAGETYQYVCTQQGGATPPPPQEPPQEEPQEQEENDET